MSILVIAEIDKDQIVPSTRATITAAKELGGDIHLFVAGSEAAAKAATSIEGITKVLHTKTPTDTTPLAEDLTSSIMSNIDAYDMILAPASTFGKNLAPRIAALMDVQQISDIVAIIDKDTYSRPVYGGQAIATVKSKDTKKVITVRATAFDAVEAEGGSGELMKLEALTPQNLSGFVKMEASESERPDLQAADIVISGGRGLGSAEEFKLIEALADKLGAAIGASRAAVDAGYVPNDYQVGQTGKVVAPKLYIAVGISGAIQHLAGMKDSKTIVAINKDEDAPIFGIADYGLVADLFEAVPELTDKL